MADRSHLSIGEVLSLLRDEFPDVTISKIRFLESQGLVDPERTPSGYRKFYDHDVERLRWILRQQREHFLPLKVIRGRLSEQESDAPSAGTVGVALATPMAPVARRGAGVAPVGSRPDTGAAAGAPSPSLPPRAPRNVAPRAAGAVAQALPGPAPTITGAAQPLCGAAAPAAGEAGPGEAGTGGTGGNETGHSRQGYAEASTGAVRVPESHPMSAAPASPAPAPDPARGGWGPGGAAEDDAETYTAEELAAVAGSPQELVSELDQYGLIAAHAVVAGVRYFDESSLAVVRAASAFSRHGVEARHLKVWRNAAEREADLFQQIVLPLLRQRNPQARRQAAETLDALAAAGGELRAALVERAVRDIR